MNDLYVAAAAPAVMIGACLLLLAAGITAVWVRLHAQLRFVAIGFAALVVASAIIAVMVLFGGGVDVPLLLGYLIASLALLPLLGISRMGTPEAARNDPGRPVLQPDQLARVDAIAAAVVAVAQAVVAWRLAEIVGAA